MPKKLLHSLKFQITAVLFLLLSLFSFAISYTLYTIDEREKEMAALHVINRLQLITSYMDMQSMNYLKNAPQSNSAYKRDIDLYYDDLKAQLNSKNEIINCFAEEHLTPEMVDMDTGVDLNLGDKTKQILEHLQETWSDYFKELNETLGNRNESPKLAAAAQYITDNQNNIKKIEDVVVRQLKQDLKDRIKRINTVNKVILAAAFLIALLTLLGFYIKVIIPLNKAALGFDRVARGDFGHQVIIDTDNEIASIAKSFNHLSQRIYSIFQLIDRIQQGDDLDNTLGFIAENFSTILPINMTSVLLHNGNAALLELQKSYKDGKSYSLPRTLFLVEGTLLEEAIQGSRPLLIANLQQLAKQNKHYVFLNLLAKEGMKSAIFLHLTQATQVPGMLVFASRQENAYSEEHIELLSNIAHLVTHSFGKTIKMAEQSHLAAIGEFTSGIVHEVRNPLTTISLALKYFSRLELDEDGTEWAEISCHEAERMGRLLEDILLYARPEKLQFSSVNIFELIAKLVNSHQLIGEENQVFIAAPHFKQSNVENKVEHKSSADNKQLIIKADSDRLSQVLLNIYRNAIEAAYKNSTINTYLYDDSKAHLVTIEINNKGDIIPEHILKRIGEPFFTTKSRGTGLGMGIVKRVIEAHSGRLKITSTEEKGTSVFIVLPYVS